MMKNAASNFEVWIYCLTLISEILYDCVRMIQFTIEMR